MAGKSTSPVTWALIIIWFILVAISFVAGGLGIAKALQKPGAASVKKIMVWSIPVICFHVFWLSLIFYSASIEWQTVTCFLLIMVAAMTYGYTMHYIAYRRLRRMEEEAKGKNAGQDKTITGTE